MTGPPPGHDNGYPHRGMSPFSPPRRPVFRPPFLMLSGQARGKGDLFGKRSPFPPHTPPILPKLLCRSVAGHHDAQALPPPLVPRLHSEKDGQDGPYPSRWRKTAGGPAPCASSPSRLSRNCPCRMPQNGCSFQMRHYHLQNTPAFPPFREEGHDSRPAGQRRGPDIPTRTKVLRGYLFKSELVSSNIQKLKLKLF